MKKRNGDKGQWRISLARTYKRVRRWQPRGDLKGFVNVPMR
jgi:hypothetical protein